MGCGGYRRGSFGNKSLSCLVVWALGGEEVGVFLEFLR